MNAVAGIFALAVMRVEYVMTIIIINTVAGAFTVAGAISSVITSPPVVEPPYY